MPLYLSIRSFPTEKVYIMYINNRDMLISTNTATLKVIDG